MGKWRETLGVGGVVAGVVIVVLALVTRLPAPWKLELINDEQHHLESWRNRYGTDDIYPLFLERLRVTGRLKGDRLALAERVYHSSPLVQRGLIVLVDPQPPLFPVMAEAVQATTDSSLVAIRIPSMLASLGAVALMFLIGRAIKGDVLGLWTAGFGTIGFLAQTMAGFGRPYAITQCAVLGTIYVFLRQRREPGSTPAKLLLVALVTQCLQWMAWAVVGPLVLADLVLRYRNGASVRQLLKQTWWYFAISLVVLVEMAVQLQNPTISQQGGAHSIVQLWSHWCIASPFAHLTGVMGALGLHVSGALSALLAVIGIGAIAAGAVARPGRVALLLTVAGGLFAAVFIGTREPFWMTYGVGPTLAAAVGADWLCRNRRVSGAVLAAVMLAFAPLVLARPADPYVLVYYQDAPYSPIARTLRAEMKPGDVWMSWPYNVGNCLYRYGPLPEPILPQSEEQALAAMDRPADGGSCFVLTYAGNVRKIEPGRLADLWDFRNGIVLVRLKPRAS
jgi:hypothetical protein